jgi:signal-transduction protein with cAMP-binding, CBS, and nucleotidyltransferase domain
MEPALVRVADMMQTSLHIVSGVASVQDAIEQMKQHKVSSLVIERRHDGDEYGLLTVYDIAAKVVAINRSTERTSVYEIMTKPALTLNGKMNVKYAIRLLARLELTRALVVGDDGGLGLVTLRDLVLSYSGAD